MKKAHAKTILITGAGKGLGFEITKKLLAIGDTVIAVSRNVKSLDKLKHRNLHIIQGDLTKDLSQIVKRVGKTKIDALLNNAGVLIKKDINKFSLNDFNTIYHTNVYAPFSLALALRKNITNGHVINVGSMGGVENTLKFPGMILYSSSKAALHCLSQCLAVELKADKITVNCISMGSVETEMVKQAFPGFKPPITASSMADFFVWFTKNGQNFFSGQIIPLALTTP